MPQNRKSAPSQLKSFEQLAKNRPVATLSPDGSVKYQAASRALKTAARKKSRHKTAAAKR